MCEHTRLRTVGHRVFCVGCGAELPLSFLMGEKPEKPAAEASGGDKPTKTPAKRKTAKNAIKGA